MGILVNGRTCVINKLNQILIDTVGVPQDKEINPNQIVLVREMNSPLYPNSKLWVISNNTGLIVDDTIPSPIP